jgi:hypothetical protein
MPCGGDGATLAGAVAEVLARRATASRRARGRRGCTVGARHAKAKGMRMLRGMSNNDMHRSRRSVVHVVARSAARRPGDVER